MAFYWKLFCGWTMWICNYAKMVEKLLNLITSYPLTNICSRTHFACIHFHFILYCDMLITFFLNKYVKYCEPVPCACAYQKSKDVLNWPFVRFEFQNEISDYNYCTTYCAVCTNTHTPHLIGLKFIELLFESIQIYPRLHRTMNLHNSKLHIQCYIYTDLKHCFSTLQEFCGFAEQ